MEHSNFRGNFLTAAWQGNVTRLQSLAAKFKFDEHLTTSDGCNALHLAAYNGQTEACGFLIEGINFNVNRSDNKGDIPLFQAIWKGHWSTAKYLIERGADVTKSNSKGSTPLLYAAKQGSEEIVQLLHSRGAATSQLGEPLLSAAMHGNDVVFKFLLDHNAKPNSTSPLNASPLLPSMQADSMELLPKYLIERGADVTKSNSKGSTPLHYAGVSPGAELHVREICADVRKGRNKLQEALSLSGNLEMTYFHMPRPKTLPMLPHRFSNPSPSRRPKKQLQFNAAVDYSGVSMVASLPLQPICASLPLQPICGVSESEMGEEVIPRELSESEIGEEMTPTEPYINGLWILWREVNHFAEEMARHDPQQPLTDFGTVVRVANLDAFNRDHVITSLPNVYALLNLCTGESLAPFYDPITVLRIARETGDKLSNYLSLYFFGGAENWRIALGFGIAAAANRG